MPADAHDPLDRVVLAVSTFRDDAGAMSLLNGLFEGSGGSPFRAVVLVDSLGDGALAAALAAR